MEPQAILTAVVGPAVGGVIAFALIWWTIPALNKDHKEQVTQLISAFTGAVDKVTGRMDHLETKFDAHAQEVREMVGGPARLRPYNPDDNGKKGA